MRPRRFILAAALSALAAAAAIAAGAVALYRSPTAVKALVESVLTAQFGARVSIGSLEYGIEPARVTAVDIALADGARGRGLDVRTARIAARFRLEGGFGDWTLWVSRLEASGVVVRMAGEGGWRAALPQPGPPSVWGRLASQVLTAVGFRRLRLGRVTLAEADLLWHADDLRAALHGVRAETTAEGVEISGGAHLLLPDTAAALELPEFCAAVRPDSPEDGAALGVRLDLPAVFFQDPRTQAALTRTVARFRLKAGAERLVVEEARVASASLTMDSVTAGRTALKAPRLAVVGSYDRAARVLSLSSWQAAAAGLGDVSGQARLELVAPRVVEVSAVEGRLRPEPWIAPAARAAGLPDAPLTLAGAVVVSGGFTLRETPSGWDGDGRLGAAFSGNRVSLAAGPVRAAGVIDGRIALSGSMAAPRLAAALSGREVALTGAALEPAPFAFEAEVEGAPPTLALPRLEVRVPAAALTVAGRPRTLRDIRVRARGGACDLDRVELSLPEVHFSSELIRNLRGALTANGRQTLLTLAGSDIGLAGAATGLGLLPPGWQLSAADRLEARAVIRPAGESTLTASLVFDPLGFSDAAQGRAAENIALGLELRARAQPGGRGLEVDAELSAGGGELLWGPVYLDFGHRPAAASARLRYDAGERRLEVADGRLALDELVALSARGWVRQAGPRAEYDLALRLPPTPVGPLFAQFVAEPLRFRQPALSELELSGALSAELGLSGAGERRALRGRVGWHSGGAAAAGGKIRAEGIDLRLPLWYESGGGGGAAPLAGELAVGRIVVPDLPDQELKLALSARPNQLSAGPGLEVRFPSGVVRFDAIEGRDVFGARPTVRTRLAAERVAVGHFLQKAWGTPVEAVVNGRLEELFFDGRDLRGRGRLVADVFGGKVVVSDPGVGALFGPAPSLRADCRIEGLDLAEATRDTAFGRIRGVLGGRIDGLQIVDGQPQGFVLTLETVRRPGVPQRINVAAVENIARIGGGQSPFVGLAGNFAAFFKEFSYDKIGIRAELENDVFKVNGTVREGGVEYLVRKGGIPGVDVVNLNPDNRISFKDMVKRIRRVAESESGPVVR